VPQRRIAACGDEEQNPATRPTGGGTLPGSAARMREENTMPKYLIEANYTAAGAKGLVKEGASARRAAVEKAIQGLGGRVEAFYYAFGAVDLFVIADLPDNVSAAAMALTVGQSGMATTRTVVLLTTEEADAAAKKTVSYRPPGG
jgi:uncharacterized protein with GYD domain